LKLIKRGKNMTKIVLITAAVLLVGALALLASAKKPVSTPVSAGSIHAFTVNDIDGSPVKLEKYRGQVVMIVNVASKCGFTPQYEGLQKLYTDYKESGLVVLGFPANNFMKQEPGSDAEIKEFCSLNFGVTFPMFSKISVKGEDIHPLYAWLTSKQSNPEFAGDIAWNFNKFLIGRDGKVIARFGSRTKPEDAELVDAVKKALAAVPAQ